MWSLDLKILVDAMPRDPFMEKMKKLNDALGTVEPEYFEALHCICPCEKTDNFYIFQLM